MSYIVANGLYRKKMAYIIENVLPRRKGNIVEKDLPCRKKFAP